MRHSLTTTKMPLSPIFFFSLKIQTLKTSTKNKLEKKQKHILQRSQQKKSYEGKVREKKKNPKRDTNTLHSFYKINFILSKIKTYFSLLSWRLTWTTQSLFAWARISLSSQYRAESDLFIWRNKGTHKKTGTNDVIVSNATLKNVPKVEWMEHRFSQRSDFNLTWTKQNYTFFSFNREQQQLH